MFAAVIVIALASCGGSNSASSNEEVGDTVGYDDIRGVQNANGNIPDTINTGATPRADKPPVDSITADSLPR